jgi:hypothetical protein
LEAAGEHYKKGQHLERGAAVERCTKQGNPYWVTIDWNGLEMKEWNEYEDRSIVGVCNLGASADQPFKTRLAVFCRHHDPSKGIFRISFFLGTTIGEIGAPMLFTSESSRLPLSSAMWKAVFVLPNYSESEIGLLASCRGSDSEVDDLFDAMFSQKKTPPAPAQLWTCNKRTLQWTQLAMVGASAANLLCEARVTVAQVGHFVVLMSATMHDVLMGAAAATESSTAVLVMDLRVREWMALPHPFRCQPPFHVLGGAAAGVAATMPAFPQVFAAVPFLLNADAFPLGPPEDSLLLLTRGHFELHSNGKDLVPKYQVSLLAPSVAGVASSGGFCWFPDILTLDKSGYRASQSKVAAVTVGDICMLISSANGFLTRVGDKGHICHDAQSLDLTADAVVDVLTSGVEWYQPQVLNTDLLGPISKAQAVHDATSDCVWLLSFPAQQGGSVGQMQAHCLHRASALQGMLKPSKASTKTAPSSQLERLRKHEARPLRSCAQCSAMETHADGFKRCGGCRKPVYCGAECQRLHWRAGHKLQCKAAQADQKPEST